MRTFIGTVCHPCNEQDRAPVQELATQVQQITNKSVEVTFVDRGYTGEPVESAC